MAAARERHVPEESLPAPSRTGLIATGIAAIVFAVAFNVPFSMLASIYSYPDILRGPAGEALDRFAAGGPLLLLTWYGFALAAIILVPLAIALSVTAERLRRWPALALSAAICGALSGTVQAIGLLRWVFAMPAMARLHADPAATAEARLLVEGQFNLLNAWGGVAIGEHLGQLLLALFAFSLGLMQLRERSVLSGAVGLIAAVVITLGTGEGLAIALGRSGELFSLATIAGFLVLTVWLILTGIGLLRATLRS